MTSAIRDLKLDNKYYDDDNNAWKYIVFVLCLYSVSYVGLMVRLLFRGKQTQNLDEVYKDFVQRENFHKSMFDKTGRKIPFQQMISSTLSVASFGIKQNADEWPLKEMRTNLEEGNTRYSQTLASQSEDELSLNKSCGSFQFLSVPDSIHAMSRKSSLSRSYQQLQKRYESISEDLEAENATGHVYPEVSCNSNGYNISANKDTLMVSHGRQSPIDNNEMCGPPSIIVSNTEE